MTRPRDPKPRGWTGSYTIFRQVKMVDPTDGDLNTVDALMLCGSRTANSPRRALSDWFDSLPYPQQAEMDGDATFIVLASSMCHELAPRVEAHPRLVF